ncbi:tryptophan transporter [Heyndrickxia acidicola]|uniref:Tryptophan transporter n=1 Tax=Heyndrickxia acidicola TaxID=209389 RepID=A0ABU6MCN8_9BACI|nr:tryptophan transporter [Heyndrickxia acidicola]MED1202437.1 tryptophan transporter [Heyndrickxia acidicola]
MNTKTLVGMALLVGIGTVLHVIVPPIFYSIKPDMMLTMLFLGIIFFTDKKNVFLLGAVAGIISGLTTSFPGGLVPNIIDKLITAFVFYGLYLAIAPRSTSVIKIALLTAVGTLVSGSAFLGSAYYIVGLPGPFVTLFATVVLPATVINAVTMFIIYPIVSSIFKRTSLAQN